MAKGDRSYFDRYERILKIDEMIARGNFPTKKDFMNETGASEATVSRDIRDLKIQFGADDILEYDNLRKGYHYTIPSFRIPGLRTSGQQIIAASLMSKLLVLIKDTPVYKQAIEVFKTLSSQIDKDSKLDAEKLSDRIVFLGMSPVKVEDDVWSKLEEAMAGNHYVRFNYRDYDRPFIVQPWQLIYSEGMWSLYAYNQKEDVKDVRFYNLPEIHKLEVDSRTFELPKDFEYSKRAIGHFRRYIGNQTLHCKIKITADEPKKLEYIKTYNWADDQKFEEQEDGSTIMTFTSNQDYPVLGWLLSHGMYARPLEPQWLVDEWKKNVQGMAEAMKED